MTLVPVATDNRAGSSLSSTNPFSPERPLNIVQVASALPNWGGLELHLLNLGVQLQSRGHRVWVAAQPGRWVEEKATALGLPTFQATLARQNDWTDFRRYYDFFRRECVDVVHIHTNEDMVVPTLAARLAGVPVAVTTWHLPKSFRTPAGGRVLMRFYNRLIAISNSVREMHLSHGVAPGKVETIHHGTDVEAFARTTQSAKDVRRALGIPEDRVVIGIVGRISHEKGHQVLLEAAQALGDRYPTHYVIIGDGSDREKLSVHAQQMGISDRVLFTGFRDDVNNVMDAMDIVTVPSTWNEPCSAVVQQAMALSKPVIGTRVGGTPEMVQEGVTGLLVPAGDAGALADAIGRLSGDAFLRRQMGSSGREFVEARFSLRVMTDRVESLYRREYENARGAGVKLKAAVS